MKCLLKKDNPVNVKTSIKALLLSLNVENSDTLPDNGVGMAFLWQQSHFSCSYTKLHIIPPSSGKHVYLTGAITAYPQILLNIEIPCLEILPEKGENTIAVKSSIFLDKSYQDSRDEIILTKKNLLIY